MALNITVQSSFADLPTQKDLIHELEEAASRHNFPLKRTKRDDADAVDVDDQPQPVPNDVDFAVQKMKSSNADMLVELRGMFNTMVSSNMEMTKNNDDFQQRVTEQIRSDRFETSSSLEAQRKDLLETATHMKTDITCLRTDFEKKFDVLEKKVEEAQAISDHSLPGEMLIRVEDGLHAELARRRPDN